MVTLDPMFFTVGGQNVKIDKINVVSPVLSDDQINKSVAHDRVRKVIGMIVEEVRSVPGLKQRLSEGAIVLSKNLFLLKDKMTVKCFSLPEVPMQDIDISPFEALVFLNRR